MKIKTFAKLKFIPQSNEQLEYLRENVYHNIEYFKAQKNTESTQLVENLEQLEINLENTVKILKNLEIAAQECDYDANTPGNGFWSYVHNLNCATKSANKVCRQLTKNREKLLFNKKFYIK